MNLKPVFVFVFANSKNAFLKHIETEITSIERKYINWIDIQIIKEIKDFSEILSVLKDEKFRNRIVGFHFSGHGGGTPDDCQLTLEDQMLDGEAFNTILTLQKSLRFVFLNACHTFKQGTDLADKGVNVIFTNKRIDDELASKIFIEHYDNLFKNNYSILESFKSALSSEKIDLNNLKDHSRFLGCNLVYNQDPIFGGNSWIVSGNEIDTPFRELAVKTVSSFNPKEIAEPLPIEPNIFGREALLVEIKDKLFSLNKPLLICGDRGIGKTSLALNYAYSSTFYENVAYVITSNSILLSFKQAFSNSKYIKIVEEGDEQGDLSKTVKSIVSQMINLEGQSLLIIDNANNEDDLDFFLKQHLNTLASHNWHIIITSIGFNSYEPIINNLNIDENTAAKIFNLYAFDSDAKTSINETSLKCINQLCETLYFNPLLIEFCAKQFKLENVYGDISIDKYLVQIKSTNFFNSEICISPQIINPMAEEPSNNISEYLAAISMDSLNRCSDNEKAVLLLLSVIPSSDYSYDFLQTIHPSLSKKWVISLIEKGFIKHLKTIDGSRYRMLEIYQIVIRQMYPANKDNCKDFIDSLIRILDLDIEVDLNKTIFDIEAYIPLAVQLIDQLNISIPEVRYDDIEQLKIYLRNLDLRGDYQINENDCTELVTLTRRLSDGIGRLGQRKLSFEYAVKSLEMNLRLNTNADNILSKGYSRLANSVNQLKSAPESALFLLQKAFDNDNKADQLYTARLYRSIGNLYRQLENFDEALKNLTISKDLIENLEKNTITKISLSITLGNLGFVYSDMYRRDKANQSEIDLTYIDTSITLREKGLELKLSSYDDKNHHAIATTYNNLATLYYWKNDFQKASEYYNECLKIRQRKYPKEHLGIALIQNNISNLYCRQIEQDTSLATKEQTKLLKKACKLNEDALKIIKLNYPVDEKNVLYGAKFYTKARCLLLMGKSSKKLKDLEDALLYINKAEVAFKNKEKPNSITLKEVESLKLKIEEALLIV